MTVIEVADHDDLRGDEVLRSRAKDVVVRELDDGADGVVWLDEWLPDKKSLEPLGDGGGLEQLFVARKIASTDSAYLVTQRDGRDPPVERPGTDWIPSEYSRIYLPAKSSDQDEDDHVPQRGLADFG